jgi:hypothetical protein
MMDATVAEDVDSSEIEAPFIPQDVGGRELSPPPPRPPSTPPLPLSPVSNPTSPARKRPRTESWRPPSHIPSFLPPFPVERSSLEPEPLSLPPPAEPSSSAQLLPSKIETAATLARVSSANPADYATIVPYSLSNLASTPEWHLPSTLRESRAPVDLLPAQQLPIPQIQPSLLGAYHHILTHPPPANPNAANPSRHRVAMVLLNQAQKNPHWEPADSLYGATSPNAPTVASVGPSYAIPISAAEEKKEKEKEDEKDKKSTLPGAAPRPIGTQDRVVPLASHQTSRIPELAREALSVSAFLYLRIYVITLFFFSFSFSFIIYHVLLIWTAFHLAGSHPISHHTSLAPKRAPTRAGKAHVRRGSARTMELRQVVRTCAHAVGDEGQGAAREWPDEWQGQGERERAGPARCAPLRDLGTRTEEFPGYPHDSPPREARECAYKPACLECSGAGKGREQSGVRMIVFFVGFLLSYVIVISTSYTAIAFNSLSCCTIRDSPQGKQWCPCH